jgi:hypothetical protein
MSIGIRADFSFSGSSMFSLRIVSNFYADLDVVVNDS